MRFQDLILGLSSLPAGSRFQDHINSISKSSSPGSPGSISVNVTNQITSSIIINATVDLLSVDIVISSENTLTSNITNQLGNL